MSDKIISAIALSYEVKVFLNKGAEIISQFPAKQNLFFIHMKGSSVDDFLYVQRLVGPISREQTALVECYPWHRSGIFILVAGHCGYAVTEDHIHPAYSFMIYAGGDSISIRSDGELSEISGSKETLIAFSPDFPHHEEEQDDFSRYYALFIERELFETTWNEYSTSAVPYFTGDQFDLQIDFMPLIKSYIYELSDRLPGWKSQMDGLEERLVHLIIRTIIPLKTFSKPVARRQEVADACEIISENFGKKLTLQTISEAVNVSSSHFSKLFREETGKSVGDYILETRMEAAAKLLKQGKNTLSEISHRCGFSSPSHFSTVFRNYYGEKPSAFQKIFGKFSSI